MNVYYTHLALQVYVFLPKMYVIVSEISQENTWFNSGNHVQVILVPITWLKYLQVMCKMEILETNVENYHRYRFGNKNLPPLSHVLYIMEMQLKIQREHNTPQKLQFHYVVNEYVRYIESGMEKSNHIDHRSSKLLIRA